MKKLLILCALWTIGLNGKLSAQNLKASPKNLTKTDTVEVLLNIAVANKIAYLDQTLKYNQLSDSLKKEKVAYEKKLKIVSKEARKKGFWRGVVVATLIESLIFVYIATR